MGFYGQSYTAEVSLRPYVQEPNNALSGLFYMKRDSDSRCVVRPKLLVNRMWNLEKMLNSN